MKHDIAGLQSMKLIVLVVLSLVFTFVVIGFRGGVAATPYDTMDSAGRTMGFNDHFSYEHYRIIVGNMNLGQMGTHEWLLVAAHLVMIVLLRLVRRKWWIIFSYALAQVLCFPWGVLGFVALPAYVLGCVTQSNDRESIVDMPFIKMEAGAVWLAVASFIGWRMWRARRQLILQ